MEALQLSDHSISLSHQQESQLDNILTALSAKATMLALRIDDTSSFSIMNTERCGEMSQS